MSDESRIDDIVGEWRARRDAAPGNDRRRGCGNTPRFSARAAF
jgi:hypothetical protein